MYFPYLYGKGAELLALKDSSSILAASKRVTPVIEPVNSAFGPLGSCCRDSETSGLPLVVVANPALGDFTNGVTADWIKALNELHHQSQHLRLAYQLQSSAQLEEMSKFLDHYEARSPSVVIRATDLTANQLAAIAEACASPVLLHGNGMPAHYFSSLPPSRTVIIEDRFRVQPRNSAYEGCELLTRSNIEFRKLQYAGFSDFGPLPAVPSFTGGPPHAVAIHATYVDPGGSLWVQHILSDSRTKGDGNVPSKMSEATANFVSDARSNPGKYIDTTGLMAYERQYETGAPTDLATSKRQQIAHHLQTVARLK